MAFQGLQSKRIPFIRALPAYVVNLILLILSMQVFDFTAVNNLHVVFFITPLFYWVMFVPSVMPLWFIFLGGLGIDLFVDSPLGLHAFLFVVYFMVLYRVRRILMVQPIMYHVAIFIISAAFFEIVRWFVLSLLTWHIAPILPVAMAIVVNIVAFFPIWLVLKGIHRIVSGYGKRQSL